MPEWLGHYLGLASLAKELGVSVPDAERLTDERRDLVDAALVVIEARSINAEIERSAKRPMRRGGG